APDALRAVIDGIAKSTLLIADGHHRYETALRYASEIGQAQPGAGPHAAHRYFMTFLVNGDDPNLVVFPTHRYVHSLPSFSFEDLLERAKATFDVRPLPSSIDAAGILKAIRDQRGPAMACATTDGRAAAFVLRADVDLASHPTLGKYPDVLRRTDVAILHAAILEHLLGITPEAQAAKTNLLYPQDARAALADLRAGTGQALFLMNPTPVADVRRVAEAGEVMPQKSTFFFPKVLTGLAIHTLEPDRTVAQV
ncbi:MAG: DUF1015 family protein, partial [Polyangiaceae bacterium]